MVPIAATATEDTDMAMDMGMVLLKVLASIVSSSKWHPRITSNNYTKSLIIIESSFGSR